MTHLLLRHYLPVSLILLFVFAVPACRGNEVRSQSQQTVVIDASGGTITLANGISVQVEPGFFNAATRVTASLSNRLPALSGSAAGEPALAALRQYSSAAGPGVTLEFDASYMNVPTSFLSNSGVTVSFANANTEEEEREVTEAEIYLRLTDSSEHINYTAFNNGGVRLLNGQLKATGKPVQTDLSFTISPVRLEPGTDLQTQAVPSGFFTEEFAGPFQEGVGFAFGPDNRVFVAEKRGVVRVVQDGNLLSVPFISMADQVNSQWDRGLLGIAVHPDFPVTPYVYLLFVYEPPEIQGTGSGGIDGDGARVSRLLRVSADAAQNYNVALPGSEVILLGTNSTYANIGNPNMRNSPVPSCEQNGQYIRDCLPSDEMSHTVGSLRFASDGALLVSNGDSASFLSVSMQEYATRTLELDSLSGKIMRIDPITGQGLADNPFYNGDPNSNRSKVLSLGLRNPFRFALQPGTDTPFIGDVGWGTWEEINAGGAANFGWPCYEGGNGSSLEQVEYRAYSRCQQLYNEGGVTAPLYSYPHDGASASAQVGDFYTGDTYPSQYKDVLFIADYSAQWIKYLRLTPTGELISVHDFGTEPGVVQLTQGPDGNLYFMNIIEGKLKRIRFSTAGNAAPSAVITADPRKAGLPPVAINFTGADSSDPDGDSLSYAWTFGDGSSSSDMNPSHTYTASGIYTVQLTVTDSNSAIATARVNIEIAESPPTATITSPAANSRYNVGETISYSGTGTDPEDGTLDGSQLQWRFLINHAGHTHFDTFPVVTGTGGSFITPDHGDDSSMVLCLTATDSKGAKTEDCIGIEPNEASYTLQTEPAGLELSWEGEPYQTPFTVNTPVGSEHLLVAPQRQGPWVFDGWSDGGERLHSLTVDNVDRTFTARYRIDECVIDRTGNACQTE